MTEVYVSSCVCIFCLFVLGHKRHGKNELQIVRKNSVRLLLRNVACALRNFFLERLLRTALKILIEEVKD
jgi:hypothetical protein